MNAGPSVRLSILYDSCERKMRKVLTRLNVTVSVLHRPYDFKHSLEEY
jgi:hypothetical protein